MSSSSKEHRSLTKTQFALLLAMLTVCAGLTLFVMSRVAGNHGACPSASQVSRPWRATCYQAYRNQEQTGVVGQPVTPPASP